MVRKSETQGRLDDAARADALRNADAVLARTTRELRQGEIALLKDTRLVQFINAGIDFVPLTELPIGISETLREGADVAILCYGPVANDALIAAEALAAVGIEATVVNARFAKPLDAERFLAIAARIGRVLTVEEHVIAGGFGSAVSELFVERGAKVELECARLLRDRDPR